MGHILHTNGVLDPAKVAKFLYFKYKLICCGEGIYYFYIDGCYEHANSFYLGGLIKYALHEGDLSWEKTREIEQVVRNYCYRDLGINDDDPLSVRKGLKKYKRLCKQGVLCNTKIL